MCLAFRGEFLRLLVVGLPLGLQVDWTLLLGVKVDDDQRVVTVACLLNGGFVQMFERDPQWELLLLGLCVLRMILPKTLFGKMRFLCLCLKFWAMKVAPKNNLAFCYDPTL